MLFEDLDWWGRMQHGLAITALMAPLSHVYGIDKIYIASSTTKETDAFWGSTPAVDNEIKWAGVSVVHDGYEADRAEKIDTLVKFAEEKEVDFPVKVCYSNRTTALNCSRCDKCCRTILLIILSGTDPNRFGFNTSAKIYDDALANLSGGYPSELIQYVWNIVLQKIKKSGKPFIFSNEKEEKEKIATVARAIEANVRRPYTTLSPLKKLRYRIQLQYPAVFQKATDFYRRFRGTR
jgi:hypothetical protein